MIVSKLDGQYNYGIDFSDRGAEVFSITMEEFQKIQSGQATMVDDEVVDVPAPEVVEPTDEELDSEQKQDFLSTIASLQQQIITNNNEYITIRDMLPEGNAIREMKLDKLAYEGGELLNQYTDTVAELVEQFGEDILSEII